MNFSEIEIQQLKNRLKEGKNLADFANLINFVNNLNCTKLKLPHKPISIKQIYHYYFNLESKYTEHRIPKKSGAERVIHAPEQTLKRIQRQLSIIFTQLYQPTDAAHGFIPNRSIVTNAKTHVGKKYVFNIDLQEFFPTIHFGRIKAIIQLPEYGFSPELAHITANFCCYKGRLPQGSPASPIITNIVCRRLDYRIMGLTQKHGFTFTRYADDITISFDNATNETKQKVGYGLEMILKEEGFLVNDKKTRIAIQSQRQEVTGLTVNKKLNVHNQYTKNIRAIFHNWEKYGADFVKERFATFYIHEKGFKKNKTIPEIENVLLGKILFLGMVRGKNDNIFKVFLDKMKNLN